MASKIVKQMRITGASRSGVRVFYALDVPVKLKTDPRCSRYRAEKARAIAGFHRKHPGSRVLEVRLTTYLESDLAW